MKKILFVYCVLLPLLVTGCVFSWKPNITDSSVNVNSTDNVEVPYEKK